LRGLRAAAPFLYYRRLTGVLMTKLTDNQRAALVMLAGSGPRGATESIMAMHFAVDLLAGLVRQGLASVAPESMQAGGRAMTVVKMRITDAGQRALAAMGKH
jgi:hypothetical protein